MNFRVEKSKIKDTNSESQSGSLLFILFSWTFYTTGYGGLMHSKGGDSNLPSHFLTLPNPLYSTQNQGSTYWTGQPFHPL